MINIIQHGTDGFGHQLHGLFTCLILHKIKDYSFDGHSFINKDFKFDHIKSIEEKKECKRYLIEIVKLFIANYSIQKNTYQNRIHSHEVYKIPYEWDKNTLYSLDNVFYFDRIRLNNEEKKKHHGNIKNISPLFINKWLPTNSLEKHNIVFHIRLGDAMKTGRKTSINNYNGLILKLIDIFMHKYKDYTYYLHTDGKIKFIEKKLSQNKIKYFISNRKEPVLNVLSHLIHANILVCGVSSLSKICSFLGNKKLTIINDDNKHSMPLNTYKISDYINENNSVVCSRE